jgi:hypothetical protein
MEGCSICVHKAHAPGGMYSRASLFDDTRTRVGLFAKKGELTVFVSGGIHHGPAFLLTVTADGAAPFGVVSADGSNAIVDAVTYEEGA